MALQLPVGRKRVVFDRDGKRFAFRRGLPGDNQTLGRLTKPTVLFLSMAAVADHPELARIHHVITRHIQFAQFSDVDRSDRMGLVQDALSNPEMAARVQALISEADLGIMELTVETEELDPKFREMLLRVLKSLKDGRDDDEPELPDEEEFLREHSRTIQFGHSAVNGVKHLPMQVESAGTIAWLALAVPAMRALRYGATLLVDEIDPSLHPKLTAALVDMFSGAKSKAGTRAQLIFTSHDTSLLGAVNGTTLGRDSIWFTEKKPDGHSELYSLAEFTPRKADNIERRYLQGRYGAVPMVSGEAIVDTALRELERTSGA